MKDRTRKPRWKKANSLLPNFYSNESTSAEDLAYTDTSDNETGTMRTSMNNTMNPFPSQQSNSRQTPSRLQNANKNGTGGGWPASAYAFGGLGGAPTGFESVGAVGSVGSGQPRPGQLSGFAQVMGGGSQQGPIDMSDFPSLSGGPRPQQNASNSASWNSNAIRQPSTSQQLPQSQQPQQRAPSAAPSQHSIDQYDGPRLQQTSSTDRTAGGEEFPPLGGQVNGDTLGQSSGFASPDTTLPRTNGQQTQLPIRDNSGVFSQTQPPALGQTSSQQTPQSSQAPPPPASGVKKYADMTESEKWGLPGFMAAFEARRQGEGGGHVDDTLPVPMRSAIVMGQDLGSLGLDLDSPDPIYTTFSPFQAVGSSGSTFDFHDRHSVPDFTLPSAYTVNNVPPLSSRMSAFSDETLFSIFYQTPRDVLQELASHELISRDWRWHKVLRQWLQKDSTSTPSTGSTSLPLIDLTNGAPIGAQPIRKSERVEQGVYVFFDAMNWRKERRYLDLDFEQLDPPRVATGVAMPNGGAPGLGGPQRVGSDLASAGALGGSSQVPGA